MEKATGLFKELGLTQDQAQKLVSFEASTAASAQQAVYDVYNTMREGWRKDVVADKVLGDGKDGLKPEVASVMAAAIDSLGPDLAKDFRATLATTGAGDNPVFLRAFHKLALERGEGKPAGTGAKPSPQGQRDPSKGAPGPSAAAMYPNLNSAG